MHSSVPDQEQKVIKIIGIPRELRNFFSHVCKNMSISLQIMFQLYVVGLLVAKRKERNVTDIAALLLSGQFSRSNLARLFSQYWWDHEDVLRQAVTFVMSIIKVQHGQKIYLLLDDTEIEKTGRKMAGLSKMRNHNQAYYFYGHCVVLLVLEINGIALPFDFRLYLSKQECAKYNLRFQTKNELAAEMIKSFTPPQKTRVILLFDCWYLNPTVIQASENKRFPYVSYLRSNRNLVLKCGRKVKVCNYAKEINYLPVSHQPRGLTTAAECHQASVVLPTLGRVKLVISRSESQFGTVTEKYLVTNQLSMPMVTVVATYDRRWTIECMIRVLKQNTGLSDYQMRDLVAIVRHLYAALIAGLLLVYLQASFQNSFLCLADVRRWVEDLTVRDSLTQMIRSARRGTKSSTIMRRFVAKAW